MDPRYALFRRTPIGGEGRLRRHHLRSIPYLAQPVPSDMHGAGPLTHFDCARKRRTRTGPL
jgi:hypothetical protein